MRSKFPYNENFAAFILTGEGSKSGYGSLHCQIATGSRDSYTHATDIIH